MVGVGVEEVWQSRGIGFAADGRALSVEGRRHELDSRSLAVLRALGERFGERVSKDELLAAAWPKQVVHENSLAKAISRLRRALAGSRLEIVASYGVGYILRDSHGDEGADPQRSLSATAASAPPQAPTRRSRPMILLGLGALALFAAVAVVLGFARKDGTPFRDTPPITHDAPDTRAIILWVDDNPSNNRHEIAFFKEHKIAVHLSRSTEDALKLLGIYDYRLVISDLGRGDDRLAGLGLTQAMKQRRMTTPIIIYTMPPKDPARQRAQRRLVLESGVSDFAISPVEVRAKVLARFPAGR